MANIELKFVHISESAFFSQEGKLNVIGVFDKIFSDSFPALQPTFSISMGIVGAKGIHKISIEIVSPQNKSIAIINGNIEIKQDGGGANFVANLVGLPFPDEGKYTIKITIDNDFIDASNYLFLEKINGS